MIVLLWFACHSYIITVINKVKLIITRINAIHTNNVFIETATDTDLRCEQNAKYSKV